MAFVKTDGANKGGTIHGILRAISRKIPQNSPDLPRKMTEFAP
jgi:hypothetical protein